MIFKDILHKQTDVAAVEMDDMYLKMAHGTRSGGRTTISKVRTLYGRTLSDEEISSSISQFFQDVKFSRGEIISVIPSRFGIYKNVEIPSVDKEEIRQIVDLQAGAHTPYPKNEIIIEHIDVGVFHERYTKILLVIFKKDIVTKRYDVIKKAGYKVGRAVLASEPEAKVFFDAIPNKVSRETVAMVDVDAGFSNFTVINEGKAIYMRSIPSGTKELSERKQEGLSAFSEEIKRSLESYQANNINDAPVKIFFIGKKDIVGELVRNCGSLGLGPEAEMFDVFSVPSMPDAGKIEGSGEVSVLSVAAPVIDSGKDYIDLTPEDIRIRREIKKKSKEALKAGVLATTTLLLFCVALLSNLMLKNMYMNKLETSYTSENEEVLKLNEVIDSTSRIKKFIAGKGAGLSGMALLFKAMPDEVFLTSIDFRDGDTFTFTGTADSMSRVFSLVTELENSKIFRDVQVDFTRSRSQRGIEVADFGLTLTFEREVA